MKKLLERVKQLEAINQPREMMNIFIVYAGEAEDIIKGFTVDDIVIKRLPDEPLEDLKDRAIAATPQANESVNIYFPMRD